MASDRCGGTQINRAATVSGMAADLRCFTPGCQNILGLRENQISGDQPVHCGRCGATWEIDDPTRLQIYSVNIRSTHPFWLPDWWDDRSHLRLMQHQVEVNQMLDNLREYRDHQQGGEADG